MALDHAGVGIVLKVYVIKDPLVLDTPRYVRFRNSCRVVSHTIRMPSGRRASTYSSALRRPYVRNQVPEEWRTCRF